MRFKPLLHQGVVTALFTAKPWIPLDQFDFRDSESEIIDYVLADCGGCIP